MKMYTWHTSLNIFKHILSYRLKSIHIIHNLFPYLICIYTAKKREQLNAGRGGGSAGLDDAELYDDYGNDDDDYDFM